MLKRSLGQNFLHHARFQEDIAKQVLALLPRGTSTAWLCEIGPGAGALTEKWIGHVSRLTLIEKDDRLSAQWQSRTSEIASRGTQVDVRGVDALEVTVSELEGVHVVVGNLPFNMSTAIYLHFARALPAGVNLVLMFQKEVAQRLLATEGKEYGSLSVVSQIMGPLRRLMEVPPIAFRPQPNVAAWVIHQRLSERRWNKRQLELLDQILRIGFGQRRKQLLKRLNEPWPRAEVFWGQKGLTPQMRAEELSPETWLELALFLDQP